MRGSGNLDLTVGNPLSRIVLFSLPLVFGTLFQQLYSFADTVIVGRCISVDALAAVGTTYSLSFLTLGFVQGSCIGFTIPIAQSFGARRPDELHRSLWNGFWLCILMSALLAASMTLLAGPLLRLIHTPDDILGMAVTYIQIVFLGIPASVLYNYTAGALRAVGDSRHPFYFLLFSSLLNIALDLVFILSFHMGVAGAALATVLSQLVSGLLNLWQLFRRTPDIRVRRAEMALSAPHWRRQCAVGLPMGFEYSVSAIGAFVMQDAINTLGSTAVAAQTAGEKIRQMFTLPMESVGTAMATYAGQNYGAGKLDRIQEGIRKGLLIQAVYCAAAWTVIFVGKSFFARLVLGEADPGVLEGAVMYLTLISTLFIIHGSLMVFRNVLQGLGFSLQAVLSGLGELAGRSLGGWLAVHGFGFAAICFANPIAWGFALCYCVIMVTLVLRRKLRQI